MGWTAKNVKEAFSRAKGSVLFIDEAYSLVDDRSGSYGDAAISAKKQVAFQYNEYGTDKAPHPRKNSAGEVREYVVNPYQMVAAAGPLSESGMDRYGTGWLEELGDVDSVARVCYLQAQVTIPAGESARVSAAMTKQPSYDHYCADTENRGVDGYDMVTRLGSTLTFTGQSAALADHGVLEIVRQNFGFDLEKGVKTVELDLSVEHYYLEVRSREERTTT